MSLRASSWRIALLCAALASPAVPAAAQATAVRFPIARIGDSTFTFVVEGRTWVSPGRSGIAVDPLRRDALVARFRVLTVDRGVATALVTGATTPLTADDMALLDQPRTAFFKQKTFWIGALAGVAIGAFVATR